jgi:hypothetical protein
MNTETLIPALAAVRQLTQDLVSDLTADEWTRIPPGYRNNLLWNLGHVTWAQQGLCYRLAGVEPRLPQHYKNWFSKGKEPATWADTPDPEEIKAAHGNAWKDLEKDLANGHFGTFSPYTTGVGVHLATHAEAIAFNNVHEGIHLGIMIRLKKALDDTA